MTRRIRGEPSPRKRESRGIRGEGASGSDKFSYRFLRRRARGTGIQNFGRRGVAAVPDS